MFGQVTARDIILLGSMRAPPAAVLSVMTAAMILLGIEGDKSWHAARQMLQYRSLHLNVPSNVRLEAHQHSPPTINFKDLSFPECLVQCRPATTC